MIPLNIESPEMDPGGPVLVQEEEEEEEEDHV
jgi:hypothetical protein